MEIGTIVNVIDWGDEFDASKSFAEAMKLTNWQPHFDFDDVVIENNDEDLYVVINQMCHPRKVEKIICAIEHKLSGRQFIIYEKGLKAI